MARIQTSGLGGATTQAVGNIDGGSANRNYLTSQDLNCGNATTTLFFATLNCGNATSTYILGA